MNSKRILALLLAVLTVFSLAACGTSAAPAEEAAPAEAPAEEAVTPEEIDYTGEKLVI